MELDIIAIIAIIILLGNVIYLKTGSFESYAICLEYKTGHYVFASYPLYEYELMENGETIAADMNCSIQSVYRIHSNALGKVKPPKKEEVIQ